MLSTFLFYFYDWEIYSRPYKDVINSLFYFYDWEIHLEPTFRISLGWWTSSFLHLITRVSLLGAGFELVT